MGTNQLWMVAHPDHYTATMVIAETREEAQELAADYHDDADRVAEYDSGIELVDEGLRWVGYESESDAEDMQRDLDAAGVTVDRVWRRVTSRPGIGPVLWEVGARDEHWCRLPAGVLCGGEQ